MKEAEMAAATYANEDICCVRGLVCWSMLEEE
jgi:hypothetical protein